MEDKLVLGGKEFSSRFILGSGKYNINLIKAAVEQGGAEIITLALRRANTQEKENILDHIPEGVTLLPNTSGARNAEEAVRIARLSRAMGCGDFVKVEIMRDTKYLFPDNYETVKATETLAKEGFIVLPYMNPDLNVARDLQSAGAAAVMPLAAPIGSNKGLVTTEDLAAIGQLKAEKYACGEWIYDRVALAPMIAGEVLADEVVKAQPDGYVKEWKINGEAVTMGVEKKGE